MATAKIIRSNGATHRVHFEFPLDHIANFVQDVHASEPNPSEELTKKFNAYAADYLKGFFARREFIEHHAEVDIAWRLVDHPKPDISHAPEDANLRYYQCEIAFPVKAKVRLVRDVECDFDALALGKRLQEIADALEAQFLAENHLAPMPAANDDDGSVEKITV